MIKIQMNYDKQVCEDGFKVVSLKKDGEYTVSNSVANRLIRQGAAVCIEPYKSPSEILSEMMDEIYGRKN